MELEQALDIIYIILITGIVGGIGNYFKVTDKTDKTGNTSENDRIDKTKIESFFKSCKNFFQSQLLKSIILGIIAAGVVPLFLNIISSNLLEFDGKTSIYRNYFIFGSFCLIAAVFSNNFLKRVSIELRLQEIERKTDTFENKVDEAQKNADAAKTNAGVAVKRIEPIVDKKRNDSTVTKSVANRRIRDNVKKTAKAYGLSEDAKSVYAELLGKPIIRTEDLRAKLKSKDVDLEASIKQLDDKGLIQRLNVDAPNDYIHLKSE